MDGNKTITQSFQNNNLVVPRRIISKSPINNPQITFESPRDLQVQNAYNAKHSVREVHSKTQIRIRHLGELLAKMPNLSKEAKDLINQARELKKGGAYEKKALYLNKLGERMNEEYARHLTSYTPIEHSVDVEGGGYIGAGAGGSPRLPSKLQELTNASVLQLREIKNSQTTGLRTLPENSPSPYISVENEETTEIKEFPSEFRRRGNTIDTYTKEKGTLEKSNNKRIMELYKSLQRKHFNFEELDCSQTRKFTLNRTFMNSKGGSGSGSGSGSIKGNNASTPKNALGMSNLEDLGLLEINSINNPRLKFSMGERNIQTSLTAIPSIDSANYDPSPRGVGESSRNRTSNPEANNIKVYSRPCSRGDKPEDIGESKKIIRESKEREDIRSIRKDSREIKKGYNVLSPQLPSTESITPNSRKRSGEESSMSMNINNNQLPLPLEQMRYYSLGNTPIKLLKGAYQRYKIGNRGQRILGGLGPLRSYERQNNIKISGSIPLPYNSSPKREAYIKSAISKINRTTTYGPGYQLPALDSVNPQINKFRASSVRRPQNPKYMMNLKSMKEKEKTPSQEVKLAKMEKFEKQMAKMNKLDRYHYELSHSLEKLENAKLEGNTGIGMEIGFAPADLSLINGRVDANGHVTYRESVDIDGGDLSGDLFGDLSPSPYAGAGNSHNSHNPHNSHGVTVKTIQTIRLPAIRRTQTGTEKHHKLALEEDLLDCSFEKGWSVHESSEGEESQLNTPYIQDIIPPDINSNTPNIYAPTLLELPLDNIENTQPSLSIHIPTKGGKSPKKKKGGSPRKKPTGQKKGTKVGDDTFIDAISPKGPPSPKSPKSPKFGSNKREIHEKPARKEKFINLSFSQ